MVSSEFDAPAGSFHPRRSSGRASRRWRRFSVPCHACRREIFHSFPVARPAVGSRRRSGSRPAAAARRIRREIRDLHHVVFRNLRSQPIPAQPAAQGSRGGRAPWLSATQEIQRSCAACGRSNKSTACWPQRVCRAGPPPSPSRIRFPACARLASVADATGEVGDGLADRAEKQSAAVAMIESTGFRARTTGSKARSIGRGHARARCPTIGPASQSAGWPADARPPRSPARCRAAAGRRGRGPPSPPSRTACRRPIRDD